MDNQENPQWPSLLDYERAGLYLGGVSRSTIKTLHGKQLIQGVKLLGRTLFTRASLDAYVDSLVRDAAPQPANEAVSANRKPRALAKRRRLA